jgi:hypothetical protein
MTSQRWWYHVKTLLITQQNKRLSHLHTSQLSVTLLPAAYQNIKTYNPWHVAQCINIYTETKQYMYKSVSTHPHISSPIPSMARNMPLRHFPIWPLVVKETFNVQLTMLNNLTPHNCIHATSNQIWFLRYTDKTHNTHSIHAKYRTIFHHHSYTVTPSRRHFDDTKLPFPLRTVAPVVPIWPFYYFRLNFS